MVTKQAHTLCTPAKTILIIQLFADYQLCVPQAVGCIS